MEIETDSSRDMIGGFLGLHEGALGQRVQNGIYQYNQIASLDSQ